MFVNYMAMVEKHYISQNSELSWVKKAHARYADMTWYRTTLCFYTSSALMQVDICLWYCLSEIVGVYFHLGWMLYRVVAKIININNKIKMILKIIIIGGGGGLLLGYCV